MKLPDFENFLETLTGEKISQYVKEAGAELDDLVGNIPVPNTKANAATFSTALGVLSAKIAALMLKDYHAWLSGDPSKR